MKVNHSINKNLYKKNQKRYKNDIIEALKLIEKDVDQSTDHIKSVNEQMKEKVNSLVNQYENHEFVGSEKQSPKTTLN